ncbi:hypothetical protein A3H38_05605 [candidate division WOR-1 bacterium RIFCSPLOWO2_02_FULL_46_20]|uniref:Probable cytosol aminopeptidase n=2 Tax=Saganbacteria TaxID=1703751 RepID=A0A1F4REN0_UNCSA|nr:MAG: hypothetical protein A3J44_01140 [candidate division WOR-1 bacterium RIFCSPHIGHO2_02_FULL_45_12]OGC06645.1 MAG: hypothetical protein A3H38_05605 [candidate division WOR-1 bacterium RIFCSPLOWO2_02_FULL_46_20]OGC08786.1 MAG: hypothetical protein A3F86_05410 [candidate division WOR-1 bacterium RIFCSPLOWO2_12_FULL_45_9]
MRIKIKCASLTQVKADLIVVNFFKGVKKPEGAAAVVDKLLKGQIVKLINDGEIEGSLGEVTIIHTGGGKFAVVGLGEKDKFGLDQVRVAGAAAIKEAKRIKAKSVATIVHGSDVGKLDLEAVAQAVVEGSVLGGYEFKGEKSESPKSEIRVNELIIIEKDNKKISAIKKGAKLGQIVAEAENRAKDLVNGPSNKITPTYLANYARQMSKEVGLKCRILDPKAEGMEAMWAVAKGSKEPAKVVVLGNQKRGTIALIGKGVTFDAGGISLKPSNKLWEMKTDMAGAAAVIETMRAAVELGIAKDVFAVIPLTENMPDGGALKPGDVVSSLSGLTTEVISTDAEGRMILADAITYAKEQGAETIVDCATLTGGCLSALGDVATGLMGNDQELIDKIKRAAEKSGEKVWQLPLYEEYKDYLKCSVADQKNCTEGRGASPSTGATFLHKFVGDTSWAHLDIAGTAYLSKGRGYLAEGATGVPVRTLIEFLNV